MEIDNGRRWIGLAWHCSQGMRKRGTGNCTLFPVAANWKIHFSYNTTYLIHSSVSTTQKSRKEGETSYGISSIPGDLIDANFKWSSASVAEEIGVRLLEEGRIPGPDKEKCKTGVLMDITTRAASMICPLQNQKVRQI